MPRPMPSRPLLLLTAVPAFALLARAGAQPATEVRAAVVRGIVVRFTIAPKGETHGLILDNGTEVRWPPHLGAKVTRLLARHDKVRVTGWTHIGKKGDRHFKAMSIVNLNTNKSLDIGSEAFGQAGGSMTVRGVVARFTRAPKGEVHGLVLDDGTELRWPPWLQKRVCGVVRQGDKLRASGWVEMGKKGDRHVHTCTIADLTTGQVIDLTDGLAVDDRTPDTDSRIRALEERMDRLRREIAALRGKKGNW